MGVFFMKNKDKFDFDQVISIAYSFIDTDREIQEVEINVDQLCMAALMLDNINTYHEAIAKSYWYCVLASNDLAAKNLSMMFKNGDIIPQNISFARIFNSIVIKLGGKSQYHNNELGAITFDEENIASIIHSKSQKFFEDSKIITINELQRLSSLINAELHLSISKQSLCFERDIETYFIKEIAENPNEIKVFVENLGDCCSPSCNIL